MLNFAIRSDEYNCNLNKIIRKFWLILLLNIICCSSFCAADIITTNDFVVIQQKVEAADKTTLVIFDVDNVLLQAKDQILHWQNKNQLKKITKELLVEIGEPELKKLYSIVFLTRKITVVEAKMLNLINNMQERNIKILALTKCATGRFGKIQSLQNWRIKELEQIGYNFARSWPELPARKFTNLADKRKEHPSAFKKGIVFTSSFSKGDVLKTFFQHAKLTPKKIIFIDDKKVNLTSVAEMSARLGIIFFGIEYTAVKDCKLDSLNLARAKIQFKILKKQHKWLSDAEADLYVTANKIGKNKKTN